MAAVPPRTRHARIHVVSDVHGNVRDLARAGEGADALVCLGDLLLFLDYADPARGIFAELFGEANARRLIALRTARRFTEARALARGLWEGVDHDTVVVGAVRKQYAELFAALPTPTYATYGNVDLPDLWPEYARPGTTVLDGERVEIAGRTFGFVGGGLPSHLRTPYEVPEEEYAAKVEALGEVDVLCSHIPPDVPELLYDTGQPGPARRDPPHPPPLRPLRPCAPTPRPAHADRRHGVRERRTLRPHRTALGAPLVTRPAAGPRRPGSGTAGQRSAVAFIPDPARGTRAPRTHRPHREEPRRWRSTPVRASGSRPLRPTSWP
jgi:Icc-related predicted phosphoesterase